MISQKYIKDLDFNTIEDIHNYIIDSKINGNYAQTKDLINKLSNKQFLEFIFWVQNNHNKYYNELFIMRRF